QNDGFASLQDRSGATTGMALNVVSPWQNVPNNTNNSGVNTGGNYGVYPDNVLVTNWWTPSGTAQTIRLTGLDAQYKYNLTFLGSRAGVSDNRTTAYTANGTTVTLNAASNSTQTVSISNIRPDAQGGITIGMQAGSGSSYGYLASLVVAATLDDSTAPAQPGQFAARDIGSGVRLSWTDQAYNETAYQLYRAGAPAGPFTLLHTGAVNDTAYTDGTAASGETWYYTARAINSYGASPYTDTVSITVPNRPPALSAISNMSIKTDTTIQVAVTATDAAGDVITLLATDLPDFISLQD